MYHKVGLTAVSLGEPGYEERETIVNGLSVAKVALRLLLCNNSFPIIDNQAQVNFVQNKAVEVLPNFSQLAL
jgi:dihydroorotase